MRITGQFPFCSAPLSVDTYVGCQGRCVYCFSQNRADVKGYKARQGPVAKETRSIEHPPEVVMTSPLRDLAAHLGGLTDPLPDVEIESHRTAKFIEHVLPTRAIMMSTKNDIRKFPRVIEAIKKRPEAFLYQASIETDDPKVFKVIGGEAQASIDERLGGIEKMSSLGVACVVRMQPFVRKWWGGLHTFLRRVADAGAKGVIVEHLKFGAGSTRWNRLAEALEKLSMSLDELGPSKREGDRSLSVMEKIENYGEVAESAHRVGIACFAADNVIRGLGDSPYCCGQELMRGFQDGWVHKDNLTAQAWRREIIDAHLPVFRETPGGILAGSGLAQSTAALVRLKRMTAEDVLLEWAKDDCRMSGMFPFARKVAPGVWRQSEEWLAYCKKIRRPEFVR